MDPSTLRLIQGAAGAAGGATYVDDVFSTFLYEGTGSAQTITNGIDLSGESGLVWLKARESLSAPYTNLEFHCLFDNVRSGATGGSAGGGGRLRSDSNQAEQSSTYLDSYNSDGFTLTSTSSVSAAAIVNETGKDFVSWSFRKAPGFFDIVTWTGDGTGTRNISHSLESTPGCVILKRTNQTTNWFVQHRSLSNGFDSFLTLNNTNAETATGSQVAVSSTELTLGSYYNTSSVTYVAYIFAHDAQSFGTNSDEAIIKCGSYNANNSASGNTIDVGFEPQWLLIKSAAIGGGGYGWTMHDNMRDRTLYADSTNAESSARQIDFTPTGFHCIGKDSNINDGTGQYIYIAIRRPHKPPTAGTDVFDPRTASSYALNSNIPCGFAPDFMIATARTSTLTNYAEARLTDDWLDTSSDAAEDATNYFRWDGPGGKINLPTSGFGDTPVFWQFRRAPGFFDVATWVGDGVGGSTKYHNLGVTPELVIIKDRDAANDWFVGSTYLDDYDRHVFLNLTDAQSGVVQWISFVNSTSFRVYRTADLNTSSNNYLCYLFATLAGISKVGTYSGTGSNVDVDCGFSSGARFILIKRTDSTGDWYTYDSARGITSGNDPYLLLNSTAAEVTGTDYIDPLNSGFTVTSTAPVGMNASGGTYLFLAIA